MAEWPKGSICQPMVGMCSAPNSLENEAMAQGGLVDHVDVVRVPASSCIHQPPLMNSSCPFDEQASDQRLDVVVLLPPPALEERLLDVDELPLRDPLQRLDHRRDDVLDRCVLDLLVESHIVLVHRLQPPHVVVGVRDDVDGEGGGEGQEDGEGGEEGEGEEVGTHPRSEEGGKEESREAVVECTKCQAAICVYVLIEVAALSPIHRGVLCGGGRVSGGSPVPSVPSVLWSDWRLWRCPTVGERMTTRNATDVSSDMSWAALWPHTVIRRYDPTSHTTHCSSTAGPGSLVGDTSSYQATTSESQTALNRQSLVSAVT